MIRMTPAGFGSQATRTDQDNEYDAFSRVTGLLKRSLTSEDIHLNLESVNKNIQLWTTLLTDLTSRHNRLPDQLKAGLISIAIFSLKHSHKVIAREADLDALIDINTHIMRGLRGETEI